MNSNQKDIFYSAMMRGLIVILKRVPFEVTGHFFDFMGRCAYIFLSEKRRDGYWNMRLALGVKLSESERRAELRAQFRHLARCLGEILSFKKLTADDMFRTIQVEHWDRIENITKQGRGVILLTAHYGNWELMQIYSGIRGQPVFALGRDQKFTRLNQILAKQRETHGSTMVDRGMSMRALFKALKNSKIVGMLGDESAGRDGGTMMPFFGKKTTIPTGAFELARRTNSAIIPCFMMRTHDQLHHFYTGEPLPETGNSDAEITENQIGIYIQLLEKYISQSPHQWLWQNKRWKYSWTRSLVILSDKKPGHFKQSQAVASLMAECDEYHDRKGLEMNTKTIEIEYHSPWHAKLLFIFGWIFIPMIRGHMSLLRFFISKQSLEAFNHTHADFIFAAGTSLAPLQHFFAAETGAKKIVMMKPSFPYGLFKYDLAIIPAHDETIYSQATFRTIISPSGYNYSNLDEDSQKLAVELKGDAVPEVALFVGGKSRGFDLSANDALKLLGSLDRATGKKGGYILTTSRRTSAETERVFKDKSETLDFCRKRIIASEDSRSFVVKGMLGLANRLLVTEDSVAMISEAIATGKPVVVLRVNSEKLALKHRKFLEKLEKEKCVTCATFDNLEEVLSKASANASAEVFEKERAALKVALEKML